MSSDLSSIRPVSTPAGWIAHRLTGKWTLGIGDASGMFPIDQDTLDYDERLLNTFDALVNDETMPSLKNVLPKVCVVGDDAGCLDETNLGQNIF